MTQIIVIFDKPIFLPDDNMQETETYGITFEKTDRATPERIEKYIKNYILAVAELYKEGIEHIDVWSYQRNGEVFYVDGPTWQEYVQKAEKAKVRFSILEDDMIDVKIKEDDLYDNYLLTNKVRWTELKALKKNEWN